MSCLGAGGLLAAAIIAGVDPKRCYGVEIDPAILKIAQNRLSKLGVPKENLVLGDATKIDEVRFPKELVTKKRKMNFGAMKIS